MQRPSSRILFGLRRPTTALRTAGRPRIASALLSYLIVAVGVTACDRGVPKRAPGRALPENATILFVGPTAQDSRGPAIFAGARAYLQNLSGLHLATISLSQEFSDTDAAALDAQLAASPAAVCLFVADRKSIAPVLAKVRERQPLLVTIGATVDDVSVFGHVTVEWGEAAELLGQRLTELAPDRRSYVLLHQDERTEFDSQLVQRFRAGAKRSAQPALLKDAVGGADPLAAARELLSTFSNTRLIVTLDPAPWLAAPPAATLPEQVRFISLGTSPRLLQALREGEALALAGVVDGEIGAAAMQIVVVGLTESEPPPVYRRARAEIVTRETVGDFEARSRAAGQARP